MLCVHADRNSIAMSKLPNDLALAHFQNAPQSRKC